MIKNIEAIICSHNGENISPEILHSKTQEEKPKTARQIIWYFGKKEAKLSLQQMGDYHGKNHATVLSGIRRINNLIETEPAFAKKIEGYKKRIDLHKDVINRIDASKLLLSDLDLKIKGCESELVSLKSTCTQLKNDIDLLNDSIK